MQEQDELKLAEYLTDLRTLDFQTLLPEHRNQITDALERGTYPRHSAYPMGNRWVVKYFFGGRQRMMGVFDDCESACRLADMIIFRFHPTKVRRKPLDENSFNYVPEQAKLDLQNEHDINSVLFKILALSPERPMRERRVSHVQASLKALQKQIDELQLQIAELKSCPSAQPVAS